ncbi:MAG: O-antigen ligase family protein [Thermodesulfobacteriota bacterium]|nr:O-antigen ligase family protein [Thermodesulfobacteriota bacterium]
MLNCLSNYLFYLLKKVFNLLFFYKFAVFFQAKTRSRAMFSILVLIAVIGLVGLFGLEPVLDRFDNVFDSTGELTDQRPIYWKNSLELIGDFSLLGSGGGSFVDSYMGYQSINTGERVVNHAHNDYLELLAEGGWLSFMLVTWFLISLLKKTWPAWKKRRNSTSRYLYPGAICGIVAILCHSVTDFNFAILPNGLFFFFLCGLLVAAAHVRSDRSGKGCDLPKISPGRILLLVAAGFLLMFGSILFHGGTLWARHICPPVAELNLAQYGTAKRLSYLEKIKTAAVYDPLNSHYRYAESYYLRSLNQIPAALTALQTAVKLRPYHGLYLQQLGQLASFQGHQEFAGQLLSNAIRVQPRLFSAHMEYGAWLFSQQRHEEAFDAFRQGIQQQPEQTGQILTLLALFRVESQQMEQVLPERSLGWQIYAEYLVALQQDMIAEAAFQKGVVLAAKEVPAITKPYWAYFNYLRKRHRHSEALTLMLDGIKNFPENGGFHSNAGVLYEQQGIIYRAMEEYQQTLLIDPQRTWVRQRLEKLQRKQ